MRCYVLLDSGADHCIFPLSFAIGLGMNPLTMKTQKTAGIGSSGNDTYYENVIVQLGPLKLHVYAGFTAGADSLGLGLLGQDGFFSRYVVRFDHPQKQFHIEVP